MTYGEYKDMLSCHSIYTGHAEPLYKMSHEEALNLR
jgi:hypothetical protein